MKSHVTGKLIRAHPVITGESEMTLCPHLLVTTEVCVLVKLRPLRARPQACHGRVPQPTRPSERWLGCVMVGSPGPTEPQPT